MAIELVPKKRQEVPAGDPEILRLLEETLESAKRGEILAIGFAVVRGTDLEVNYIADGFEPYIGMGAKRLMDEMSETLFPFAYVDLESE